MSEQDENNKAGVNADNNSVAVGSISVGGNVRDIHIGNVTNVYSAAEDDVPLSSAEIENGLTRFAKFLPERAPVMANKFNATAKKLRATLGADVSALSPTLKTQREDSVNVMKMMCLEALDISFRALCLGDNPPPYDSRPPFLGLFAFHPEDREFFFGREALIQKLVKRIKRHSFLAVVGASGSGKSSLVMAGLIPALDAEMAYFTPSDSPAQQLQNALAGADANAVIVADQFEELFTLTRDAKAREEFIAQLLELAQTRRVILTLRADFWGEVAAYKNLKGEMQDHQELIAPMDAEELRAAMEQQAEAVGLRFDPSLRETILAEVKDEPGAMPLLQHALWMLWKCRHGLWLKADEYQSFGGVRQAIASTAEDVYASCSDYERERVRDIFLRLTRLDFSDEGRDTRRRVPLGDLMPSQQDAAAMIALLDKLANARLIVKTVDGDQTEIEVAHEALIRHWERLRGWLNEDRDQLRLRESVTESAKEWDGAHKDEGLLNHRGGRLEDALALKDNARYGLTALELAYLNACVELRNRQQYERERRLRYTVMASIAVAIIFLALGSFGWMQRNEATSQAATAVANEEKANTNYKKALANQINMQARKIFDSDQEAAVLLAAQSMKAYPSKEAEYILRNNNLPKLVSQESYESHVESYEGDEYGIKASSSDGRYQAKGKYFDQSFIMVNAAGESEIPIDGLLTALAISPEGNFLAAGVCVGDLVLDNRCAQTYIFLWNTTTDEIIARVPQEGEVFDIRFIRFGGEADYLVASGGNNGMVRIWMTTCAFGNNCELARAGTVVADLQNGVHANSMAVSSDNNFIVVGGCDHIYYGECEKGVVRVWELQSEDYVEVAKVVLQGDVAAVDFYSNGQFTVISGGLFDKLLSRWDFANRDVEDTCSLVTRNLTHAEWDQYIGDVLPYQAVCPNLPIEPEAAVTPTP